VKRLLALLAGGLGLRAILAQRRSRRPASSHAADLRAKLDESRAADAAVPDEETPPPAEQDVDTRRADVHARARQAIDDLS
jgi:hypothetical protein